jgi:hypothetical protein
MADLSKLNTNSEWLEHNSNIINDNNTIDHFFTQRKVTEIIEKLDKSLERTQHKIVKTYNFLAINFPIHKLIQKLNLIQSEVEVNIEIHGDKNFHYSGIMKTLNGEIPNLMLKLKNDTEMFIKYSVKYKTENHNYISFIPINKRYQGNLDNCNL